MKKRIGILLLALMLLVGLCACDKEEPEHELTYLTVATAGVSEYTVMRSDRASNDSPEVQAAVTLRQTFERVAGVQVKIATDWVKRGEEPPVGTKELLVGRTNRPETEAALALIAENQYIIKAFDGRIVMVGGTEEGTQEAVDVFIAEFVLNGEVKIPDNYEKIAETTYEKKIDTTKFVMTLTNPNGPLTDEELWGYKNYIKSTLARPVDNIDNKLVYKTIGLATEAMGLMYEITQDIEILDIWIEFCDKMLYCRNDMPGGDGRVMWTGKVEPAWPNKARGTSIEGYASSENGDIVGHILYCSYLILKDPALHDYAAPKSQVLKDCGETYRDRALYYLTMLEPTLDYLTEYFVRKDTLHQRFPTSAEWKAMDYNNGGGHYPVNQQMMFNNGFLRAMQIYRLLGRNDEADRYHAILEASLKVIQGDQTLHKKDGYEYYTWNYDLPKGKYYEDFGHGAFSTQGFYRMYVSGEFSHLLTETEMIRLGNSVKYAYYNEAKGAFEHNWKNDTIYKGPRAGWVLMTLYSEVSRDLVFRMYQSNDLKSGSTKDSGLFGHMLYVKCLVYGSELDKAVVRVTDR